MLKKKNINNLSVETIFLMKKFSKFFKISLIGGSIRNNRFLNFNNLMLGFRKSVYNKRSINIIFNLYKNYLMFYKIILIIKQLVVCGGNILFINTIFLLYALLKNLLKRNYNLYYVLYFKWIQGTFSNYNQTKWFHMKYGVFNKIPHKKPDLAFILEIEASSISSLKEMLKKNIPVVSFLNFKNSKKASLLNKISYPLISNYLYKKHMSIFFLEIFSYFINLFKINSMLLKKRSKISNFRYLKYIKINKKYILKVISNKKLLISNDIFNKNYKFSSLWSSYLNKKFLDDWHKLSEIEPWFPINRKWNWLRQKKYKKYNLYVRRFLQCGKFGSDFKKRKLRILLLKKIFCNIFDYQYNFKAWWRVVKGKGFFSRYKKFSKRFKNFYDFINFLERNFFLIVKRLFIQKSLAAKNNILWKNFLINNSSIKNVNYLLKNGSLIQKKLFSDNVKHCFRLLKKSHKWSVKKLGFLWRQKFFSKVRNLFVKEDPVFNFKKLKITDIPYYLHRNNRKKFTKIFYKRYKMWKLYGSNYYLTWYSVLKQYLQRGKVKSLILKN